MHRSEILSMSALWLNTCLEYVWMVYSREYSRIIQTCIQPYLFQTSIQFHTCSCMGCTAEFLQKYCRAIFSESYSSIRSVLLSTWAQEGQQQEDETNIPPHMNPKTPPGVSKTVQTLNKPITTYISRYLCGPSKSRSTRKYTFIQQLKNNFMQETSKTRYFNHHFTIFETLGGDSGS